MEAAGGCGSPSAAPASAGRRRPPGKRGPHSFEPFQTVINVNLIGTFNVLRLAAAAMLGNEPDDEGERGVCINTASIAAYDGQIGQIAYSASKGGDRRHDAARRARPRAARHPRRHDRARPVRHAAARRRCRRRRATRSASRSRTRTASAGPTEYAALAAHIVENPMLNGEVIRLDGALRMPPR